jgi:pyrroloquinoline quinone (PQQ) biosynthesis protein C
MRVLSRSQDLREKIALVSPRADNPASVWNHPELRRLYPDLLFTVHCIIRASVPLMESALAFSRRRAHADPVAAELAEYLAEHIPQEMHHDDWLLEDMEVLRINRAQVLQRIPSPAVAVAVGAQYYWIHHYHPVALLGYIAVLEGQPPVEASLEEAVALTGFPREAFRTFFKHAQLDPHHRDELNQLLDRLQLSAEQSALISISAMSSASLLDRAFEEVLAAET